MKVALAFVPPGGGETDYYLEFEMPSVPQAGDYISVLREGADGAETFIVKRTQWSFETSADGKNGKVSSICVECEFAEAGFSSSDHKRAVERYEAETGKKNVFDVSVY